MKIGGAALNQTPIDWENNLKNIRQAIEEARRQGVNILCLPELCLTGYGCEDLFLSKWVPTKALSLLQEIVPWCRDICVVLGVPVLLKGKLYNCACTIENREIKGFYAKQYLANDGVHYEPRWFTSWKHGAIAAVAVGSKTYPIGDLTFQIQGVHIGFEICEDAWRGNDRPACRLWEKGVQLILNPSASHFAMGKSAEREKLVLESSAAFRCTYVYANLLGNEAGRMIFDGEIIIAREGNLLERSIRNTFASFSLLTVELDFSQDPFNPHAFQPAHDPKDPENEFLSAATLGLFDYLRKSRSRGFALSLSGGADSTCCAVLVAETIKRAVKALGTREFMRRIGRENEWEEVKVLEREELYKVLTDKLLTCAYQATQNSSQETLQAAKCLTHEIGAEFHVWSVDEEVASYSGKIEKALARALQWETDDIAMQNIQARARSPIIWMLANLKQSILLTTSNRSEGDVGYATMDGDTSGSLAPIAAVSKHFIVNWLKWAQSALGYQSLQHVNALNPSAELRPLEQQQTDEDDLMPYFVMLEIEKMAIRKHLPPVEVFQKLKLKKLESDQLLKQHILKFYRLWARNQWKRERTAPAFHLDDFNIDPRTWCRFPILSSGFEAELIELENL